MADTPPKVPMNRRTTYQAAGRRSSGRGTVITTQGGGSTATINPGADNRMRRQIQQDEREERRARGQRIGLGDAATAVTQRQGRYTAKHMLTAELLIGVIIVAIRAVADYEPQADGTLKGKVGHPKGQYGPLPILAGLIVTFFLLSFLAASGGLKGKLAVIAGGIIDLGLLMNSSTEFQKVSATFANFGTAKVPPGSWETGGTAAGLPISGSLPSNIGGGSAGGGGGNVPSSAPPGSIPLPAGGKCPAGYIEGGIGNSPRYCAPLNQ